jgi:hypothetical protein
LYHISNLTNNGNLHKLILNGTGFYCLLNHFN